MASTGNVFPTAGASVDRAGSTAWTNPGNVVSDNTSGATTTVPTDYLVTSAYGFTIPANATILGITVRVEATEAGSGSSSYIPQLHSNTTPTLIGSAKGAVTVTNGPTVSSNGGATDLWGATLTPAIVNAAGFGVSIWSTDTINTLDVDYLTIAVEWSECVLWDPQRTRPRRRNTTNRRVLDVLLDYPAVQAETSPDATLEAPFRTRVIASRRAKSIGWMSALTAQIQAPAEQPIAAWATTQIRRRRETERTLRIADPVAIERYTPPSIAWSDPPQVIKVEFRRTLQEQAPQLLFPPTTGPPPVEYYPAWATTQRPPTFQDRRLQRLEHNVYPETPAVEVSDDRALEAPFRTRTIRSRRFIKTPGLESVQAATPPGPSTAPISAVVGVKTKRRKHRQGLFLWAAGEVEARPPTPFPSYARPEPKRRRSTNRKLQPAAPLPSTPATPAVPAQPITAWLERRANRVERDKHRLSVEHDVWTPTPVHPIASTPRAESLKRRDIRRTLRNAAHSPSYPPPIVLFQEPSSWKLAEVFRRHGWRIRRDVLEINEYPVTPPAPPVIENPGGHYWPTKGHKRRDYREAQDEERQRDKQELRELIERAAGLIEEAAETAPAPEVAEVRQELRKLSAQVQEPKGDDSPTFDPVAWQAEVDSLVASTVDELIVRVADVLTEIIQEIGEDDF